MASPSDRLASRILWSLVIGAALGCATLIIGNYLPSVIPAAQKVSVAVLDPIGQIFLRLLFFVVVPLVFASLALGIAQLGQLSKLGPLAVRTALFFFLNMSIGVALGLLAMNLFEPGSLISAATRDTLMEQFAGSATELVQRGEAQPKLGFAVLVEMFMPRNLLLAVVNFQILPLIVFALLVGAAGTQMDGPSGEKLRSGLQIVCDLMTKIVHYALLLAPIAVPAMIYSIVVKAGVDILASLGLFVLICVATMALHLFGTMSLWLMLLSRHRPWRFWRDVRTVLVTAFSTSSSSATLPTSLQVSREVLKISPSTSGFVLPLGATMNMSGTALYEGCVVLFIAQIFGIDLSFAAQFTLLMLAVMSAVAVAAIPGGSLPLIAGLLAQFGINPGGIAIILGADRILDMCRTVVNVGADLVTATVVDDQINSKGKSEDPAVGPAPRTD
ncbi:MAG TPA: dicarboxylate/amino acid:cation symporter [Opitutaceae bacterium]|nr:dicarboxylate/amino acid:cation symporter [Opitutaceae bacterium]